MVYYVLSACQTFLFRGRGFVLKTPGSTSCFVSSRLTLRRLPVQLCALSVVSETRLLFKSLQCVELAPVVLSKRDNCPTCDLEQTDDGPLLVNFNWFIWFMYLLIDLFRLWTKTPLSSKPSSVRFSAIRVFLFCFFFHCVFCVSCVCERHLTGLRHFYSVTALWRLRWLMDIDSVRYWLHSKIKHVPDQLTIFENFITLHRGSWP